MSPGKILLHLEYAAEIEQNLSESSEGVKRNHCTGSCGEHLRQVGWNENLTVDKKKRLR
jgi:hypothetical protein